MKLNLLIAPDFAPERFAGWHMLNTLLQRKSGLDVHLLTPASAAEQAALIAQGQADAIYANPFDSATLIHDQGYRAVARPVGKSDEMVIASAAGSPASRVEDLRPGCRIALTDNKDVKLVGLRLLEPADLTEADIQWRLQDTYQAVARMTIKGEADAGFFMAEAYHSLSQLTRSQLKPLIESALYDISHVMLVHHRMAGQTEAFTQALLSMGQTPDGPAVLNELGMPRGFAPMSEDEAEFLIDLMDTLLD